MSSYRINILKSIGKDTLLYIPAKFLPPLLSIASLSIFTRFLQPKEYGQYVLIISFISFLNIFFFNWLGASSFRFYEQFKIEKKLSIYGSTILSLYGITSIFLWSLGILFYFFFGEYIKRIADIYWVALLLLWLNSFFSISLNYIRASRQIVKYNMLVCFESLMKIGFAVGALTILSMKFDGIIWGYCIAYLLIVPVILIDFLKVFNIAIKHYSIRLFKSFANYGIPLVGANILVWVLSLADRYILQLLKGSEYVGIYGAGYQIAANLIQFPSSLLMLAAFPVIIQVYEGGMLGETEKLLTKLVTIYIVLCIPILLIISLFHDQIVSLFLGSGYGRASSSLMLISLGQAFLGMSVFFNKAFELKKKTYGMLIFLIIAAVLNVGLNFMFIPSMNEFGAALATVISYLAYLALIWIYGNKLMCWEFPYLTLSKCFLSAAVCYGLFSFYKLPVMSEKNYAYSVMVIIICLSAYFVILLFMKERSVGQLLRWFGK